MTELRDMTYPFSVPSVVGAWHLDELTGTTAADWSGSGYTITYDANAPTQFTTPTQSNGQIQWNWGGGLSFDGTNDGTVRSGAATNLQLQTLTIEALIYIPTSYGASGCIIAYWPKGANNDGRGWGLVVLNTGKLHVVLGNAGGAWQTLTGNTAVPLDTWRYVAFTFDGTIWRLYLKGVEDNSKTQALTISYADSGAFPGDVHALSIGRAHDAAATPLYFLKGYIADVRVSSVVRTPAEIAAMQEYLFPTAQVSPGLDIPRGFGMAGLPFSPYFFYKGARQATQITNNVMLAP